MTEGTLSVRTILPRLAAALALTTALAAPARAQTTPAAATAVPSANAMVNLVRALVAKGTLSAAEGDALLQQANAEAAQARAATPPPGTVRVPYVPESVRAQIRDELKADVLQIARAEGWATPGGQKVQAAGDSRIKLFGDFRYRAQFNYFGRGNLDNIFDYNSINNGGPNEFNTGSPTGSFRGFPFTNTTRDRNNLENIRLRFGLTAKIADPIDFTIRLASGGDNGPVSTSQTLGGGFTKKDIWLDQAFVNLRPLEHLTLTAGRMPNPFYSNDVIWDPDVNFDGIVATVDSGDRFGERLGVHAVAGAFPFEYGADNFPSTSQDKPKSVSKWLYSAQFVGNFQFRHDIGLKAGAAYYYFDNVKGRLSDPCDVSVAGFTCSTDQYRPAYLQKGNTLFALRNAFSTANPTNSPQPQLLGLVFDYHILDLNTDVTVQLDDKKSIVVGGDYIKNLGLKRGDLCKSAAAPPGSPAGATVLAGPINNVSNTVPCATAGNLASYNGGDTAWMARVSIGYPAPKRFGEWNVFAQYKYIESDAVLDSLVDNDFHLGGTNAEGYVIGGTLGLFENVAARARWLSANAIRDQLNNDVIARTQPLAIDVLQLDFLVSF